MSGHLNQSRKTRPSIQDFFFEATYGTRESQKVVTDMANEIVRSLKSVDVMQSNVFVSGRKLLVILQNSDITYSEEDEHKLIVNLQGMESDMLHLLEVLITRENSVVCDGKLYGNNEEKVVKAYAKAIKKQKSLIGVTQDIRRVVDRASLADVHIHDIRRTAITNAKKQGRRVQEFSLHRTESEANAYVVEVPRVRPLEPMG